MFYKIDLDSSSFKDQGGAYGEWLSFMKDQFRMPFFVKRKKQSRSLIMNFPWVS